jgi:hypothetical protein
MNVRTVPATATDEADKNVLRLIYKTRLKLFWRPVGLNGTPSETCKNLRFARHGQQLTVINEGRFTASLTHLRWARTKWRKPIWLPLNPALTFLSRQCSGDERHLALHYRLRQCFRKIHFHTGAGLKDRDDDRT